MNLYNILFDSIGALLVVAIFAAERRQKRRGDPMNAKLLHILMLCCAAVFLTDIGGYLLDGIIFPGAKALLWVIDTAYWALQVIYCWLWLLFADYWAFASVGRMKRRALFCAIPMIIELALLAANPATGWIFKIDEANLYARGDMYLLNMLPYVIYITATLCVVMYGAKVNTDPERKRKCMSLVVYMFLPICGVALDAFVYGISWVWPMVALSLLMVFLNVQQQAIAEEQLAAARLQSELTESRIAIMLSQIQPHFLYNALSSIQCLCRDDPATAERATADFSMFLRGNMESLTADKPISFEQELEHTRHYLSLETLRFPDRLTVEYDIGATLFRLPTLSLQPIVENAVRYGVTKKIEGGTVRISSRETSAAFVITITDDGVGFDPNVPRDDSRIHVGIANVRDRLARMSGGTLEITSTPGVGTTAVITIPKGR